MKLEEIDILLQDQFKEVRFMTAVPKIDAPFI